MRVTPLTCEKLDDGASPSAPPVCGHASVACVCASVAKDSTQNRFYPTVRTHISGDACTSAYTSEGDKQRTIAQYILSKLVCINKLA